MRNSEAIGKKRGMLMSGGVVNTERAAIAVVDEFRSAKLGKITLEQVRGIGMNWYTYEAAAK